MTPEQRRFFYPNGWRRHAVTPCDEPDCSRTWDIWRFGQVVEGGVRTRRLARLRARSYDAVEQGSYPLDHDRAHDLADVACDGGDIELALRQLKRSKTGSVRLTNRILNLEERLAKRAS